MKSKIFGTALFAVIAFVGFSAVAHADVPASGECTSVGSTVVDTTYQMTNDPDSGTFGGNWALDTFTRHIQIWPESTYFCAKATDTGAFVTTGKSPSGTTLVQDITGTMTGTVVAKTTVAPNGNTSITNPDCLVAGECDGLTGKWLTYFFDSSVPASDYYWSWMYTADKTGEVWTNSLSSSGDIHPVYDSTSNVGYADLQSAVNTANPNDTIKLASDITTTAQVTVNKALTIDGNGFKLSTSFIKTDNTNNSAIGIIGTSNVTIKNIVIDGTSGGQTYPTQLHGINIYASNNVNLNDVTVTHNGGAGVTVNSSTVTINHITTSNNGWGGINADQAASAPTVVTINGTSSHSESASLSHSAIWIDDVAKNVTVTDSANQYSWTMNGNTRSYNLGESSVAITSSNTTPVDVTVADGGTTSLDLGTLVVSAGVTSNVITPAVINIDSSSLDFSIPSGTVVTGSATWDGTIDLPHVSSQTIAPSVASGETASIGLSLSVGSDTETLTFSNAVRLLLAGQAGKRVGFAHADNVFTEITNSCANDSQVDGDALSAGTECKIDVGADLVVWTKHFTTFATYSVSVPGSSTSGSSSSSSRSGSTSGGGSSSAVVAVANTNAPVGQVLGASTFRFSSSLTTGASSDAVMELQNRMKAEGYFSADATGYFGSITLAAVKAYQTAHGISATGFVGPLTIAQLNAETTTTTTTTSNAAPTAGISVKQFVNLLIGLGVIAPGKIEAAQAWAATSGN